MRLGYKRVSTIEQNTARQLDGIEVDKVYEDKCSGSNTDRPQLQRLLDSMREGDTVIVHDISRLARNLTDLLQLIELINSRGCGRIGDDVGPKCTTVASGSPNTFAGP